jgi:hypothetical protein
MELTLLTVPECSHAAAFEARLAAVLAYGGTARQVASRAERGR